MIRTALLASAAIGVAAFSAGGAQAQAQVPFDWTGFYAGFHGGFLSGDVTVHEEGIVASGGNISGFVGGGIAGYNFLHSPVAPYLFGIEGDIGWASVSGNGGGNPIPDSCADYFYDLNWDGHLRARIGMPMGNVMPFIAGGLAFADLDIGEQCRVTLLDIGGSESSGGVFVGGTIGGGLDFQLAKNLTGRAEVLYDVYGNKQYDDFSASFHAWTVRMAVLIKLP